MMAKARRLRSLRKQVVSTSGRLPDQTIGEIIAAAHGQSGPITVVTGCGDDGSDELQVRAGDDWSWTEYRHAAPDVSLDGACGLITVALPGWCWKTGTCHVSDDAWVCPDWRDPEHGERLYRELGGPVYGQPSDHGFDVDRRPPGNVPLALLEAMLSAMIWRAELPSPHFVGREAGR